MLIAPANLINLYNKYYRQDQELRPEERRYKNVFFNVRDLFDKEIPIFDNVQEYEDLANITPPLSYEEFVKDRYGDAIIDEDVFFGSPEYTYFYYVTDFIAKQIKDAFSKAPEAPVEKIGETQFDGPMNILKDNYYTAEIFVDNDEKKTNGWFICVASKPEVASQIAKKYIENNIDRDIVNWNTIVVKDRVGKVILTDVLDKGSQPGE